MEMYLIREKKSSIENPKGRRIKTKKKHTSVSLQRKFHRDAGTLQNGILPRSFRVKVSNVTSLQVTSLHD